jgi:hypothetical protein
VSGDNNETNFDYEQPPEQPTDVFSNAVEKIQFGDPSEARDALVGAVRYSLDHQKNLDAIKAEEEANKATFAAFQKSNPQLFKDKMTEAAGRQAMYEQQLVDVVRYGGLDVEKYRNENGGMDPPQDRVAAAHLSLRAGKVKGVRSAAEMLEQTARELANRFGIKRPGPCEDDARSAVVRSRIDRTRVMQGLPKSPPAGEPAEAAHESLSLDPATFTTRVGFGDLGKDPDSEATSQQAIADRRANAVADQIEWRRNLRGHDGKGFAGRR